MIPSAQLPKLPSLATVALYLHHPNNRSIWSRPQPKLCKLPLTTSVQAPEPICYYHLATYVLVGTERIDGRGARIAADRVRPELDISI